MTEQQQIPQVFVEIAENQRAREALKAAPVIGWEAVRRFGALKKDMDNSLRPAAEAIVRRPNGGKGARL